MDVVDSVGDIKSLIGDEETFYKSCRLCARYRNREVLSLYQDSNTTKKIETSLRINISKDDKLPQVICTVCLKLLDLLYIFGDGQLQETNKDLWDVLYMFREQCQEVDAALNSLKLTFQKKKNDQGKPDDRKENKGSNVVDENQMENAEEESEIKDDAAIIEAMGVINRGEMTNEIQDSDIITSYGTNVKSEVQGTFESSQSSLCNIISECQMENIQGINKMNIYPDETDINQHAGEGELNVINSRLLNINNSESDVLMNENIQGNLLNKFENEKDLSCCKINNNTNNIKTNYDDIEYEFRNSADNNEIDTVVSACHAENDVDRSDFKIAASELNVSNHPMSSEISDNKFGNELNTDIDMNEPGSGVKESENKIEEVEDCEMNIIQSKDINNDVAQSKLKDSVDGNISAVSHNEVKDNAILKSKAEQNKKETEENSDSRCEKDNSSEDTDEDMDFEEEDEIVKIKEEPIEDTGEMQIDYEKLVDSMKISSQDKSEIPFTLPLKVELHVQNEVSPSIREICDLTSGEGLSHGEESDVSEKYGESDTSGTKDINTSSENIADYQKKAGFKRPKARTAVQCHRFSYLEEFYSKNNFPSPAEYTQLENDLGVTRKYLRKWFERRRHENRKNQVTDVEYSLSKELAVKKRECLEKIFETTPNPNEAEYTEMQKYLGVTRRYLQFWFCLRRAKQREDPQKAAEKKLEQERKNSLYQSLENFYKKKKNLEPPDYIELQEKLGVSRNYLVYWFCKRRRKDKKGYSPCGNSEIFSQESLSQDSVSQDSLSHAAISADTQAQDNDTVLSSSVVADKTPSVSSEISSQKSLSQPTVSSDVQAKNRSILLDSDSQIVINKHGANYIRRKPRKAPFRIFNDKQTEILENMYLQNKYPFIEDQIRVAEEFKINRSHILKWFQTRRFKEKRDSQPKKNEPTSKPLSLKKKVLKARYAFLEKFYESNPVPSTAQYTQLHEKLGVSQKYIRNWFHKKRAAEAAVPDEERTAKRKQEQELKTTIYENLENFYKTKPNPNSADYTELQKKFGVSRKYLFCWFSTRRAKDRKDSSDTETKTNTRSKRNRNAIKEEVQVPVEIDDTYWEDMERLYMQRKGVPKVSRNKSAIESRWAYMEEYYKRNPRPDAEAYAQMQKDLGVTQRYLTNWFSVRRAKDKKGDNEYPTVHKVEKPVNEDTSTNESLSNLTNESLPNLTKESLPNLMSSGTSNNFVPTKNLLEYLELEYNKYKNMVSSNKAIESLSKKLRMSDDNSSDAGSESLSKKLRMSEDNSSDEDSEYVPDDFTSGSESESDFSLKANKKPGGIVLSKTQLDSLELSYARKINDIPSNTTIKALSKKLSLSEEFILNWFLEKRSENVSGVAEESAEDS